jgi:hypothetical protein
MQFRQVKDLLDLPSSFKFIFKESWNADGRFKASVKFSHLIHSSKMYFHITPLVLDFISFAI